MSELLTRESLGGTIEVSAPGQDLEARTTWARRGSAEVLSEQMTNHIALSSTAIGVVIGGSSPALLRGLESLVMGTGGFCILGVAQSIPGLFSCCERFCVGVALVDPSLGQFSLRAFMGALRKAAPHVRVVLIVDDCQPVFVREAVTLGVCGLVGRGAEAEEIRAALLSAASGKRYIAPALAGQLAESLTLEKLTNRESQVLGLLSRGDCNKAIARTLDVAVGTVKTHVRAIMCKLGARSRTEAVLKGFRFGLVGLESL